MQMQMFDPREAPTATEAILADVGLRAAISNMREIVFGVADSSETWPYVERLCEVEGNPAWAVDDAGLRYVVANGMMFDLQDLVMAEAKIQKAARNVFARLEAGVSA